MTNQPLRKFLHCLDTFGLLLKWCIKLSQYDITYHPWTAIRGQALVNFIAKFTNRDDEIKEKDNEVAKWNIFVDGASNEHGLGAGVHYSLRM